MYRFIRHFFSYLKDYDHYYWFVHNHLSKEALEECGGDTYKNRFDYAWKNSLIWWKHRDRYSRKCKGECEDCKLKHC